MNDAFITCRNTSIFSVDVIGAALSLSGNISLGEYLYCSYLCSCFFSFLITVSVRWSFQRSSDLLRLSCTPFTRFFSMFNRALNNACLLISVLLSS